MEGQKDTYSYLAWVAFVRNLHRVTWLEQPRRFTDNKLTISPRAITRHSSDLDFCDRKVTTFYHSFWGLFFLFHRGKNLIFSFSGECWRIMPFMYKEILFIDWENLCLYFVMTLDSSGRLVQIWVGEVSVQKNCKINKCLPQELINCALIKVSALICNLYFVRQKDWTEFCWYNSSF